MSEQVQKYGEVDSKVLESLVLQGDISKMQPEQKVTYYRWLCESLGLNPATQPFQIIKFQGREQLYAKKDATEQLRKIYGVSVTELEKLFQDGLYIVTAKVSDKTGRCDAATGAVVVKNLVGENLANAIMKAETKAKRRATLSICGLGMLDESETDTIGKFETVDIKTGEITSTKTKDEKVDEQVAAIMTDVVKRNYYEESKNFKTLDEIKSWWDGLSEVEKKEAYKAKEQAKFNITKENVKDLISKLRKDTYEKNAYTIEPIIDSETDKTKKEELISLYNARLEHIGVDYRYTPSIFDK